MGYTGYCVDSPKLTHLRNVSPQSMPANSRTERAQALEKERKRQKTCFELFGEFRSRFLQILGFVFKPMASGKPLLNVRLTRCALPWHTLDIAFSLKGHEVHSRMKDS